MLTEGKIFRVILARRARTYSFYDQIDSVAMGSPLAPVLANLFMGHGEKLWLQNNQDSEILFYRRYVDDTFCLFRGVARILQRGGGVTLGQTISSWRCRHGIL